MANVNTGEIFHEDDFESRGVFEKLIAAQNLAPLLDTQFKDLKPMATEQRKGYMRNMPCVCGSGEKFKKCCWDQYETTKE